jgi:hypothetical protein
MKRSLPQFCSRVAARCFAKTDCILYACDLPVKPNENVAARIPVEFRVNCPQSIEILRSGDARYGLEPRHVREIAEQLAQDEACVSGWCGNELVFYIWVQFKHRRLARHTRVPLAKSQAALYRGFTRADFRGQRIYPAALQFACRWLAEKNFHRALVDHDARNVPSQKGILAAGFRPIGEYRVFNVCGFKWASLNSALRKEISGENHG